VDDRLTVKQLAQVLGETEHRALAKALRVLGQARALTLLIETLHVESQGGLLTLDQSRRRSRGGTFLALCREQATRQERRQMCR